MLNKSLYLSGLNGLRAIASLAVVFSHLTLELEKFNLSPYLLGKNASGKPMSYQLASHGVTIFFVLSGFLITYLIQLEKEKTNTIAIKKFYLRRILRIWPLYYLYFILAIITTVVFSYDFNSSSILFYVLFTANVPFIMNMSLPFLHHYWSIGVEEQFYLFWPWLNKLIDKNLIKKILLLIIIINVIRIVIWLVMPYTQLAIATLVNRFDCMMIGGVGAFYFKKNNLLFMKIVDNKISQSIAFSILLLVGLNSFHINSIIDTWLLSLVALTLIVGQINVKNRIVNLDTTIFNFLGKISYGVYVYHPLIIFYLSFLLKDVALTSFSKYIVVYASVFGVTILISYISFEYFEKWFRIEKDKYAIVKSSGSRN